MLIHIAPRFLLQSLNEKVELIDVSIPELSVQLRNDIEIRAGKPFLNKKYLVAMKKNGRKNYTGISFLTEKILDQFSVVTRWAINAEHISTHTVQYDILDHDFDVVSGELVLWYGFNVEGKKFHSRFPKQYDQAPIKYQPRMELFTQNESRITISAEKTINGKITERHEKLATPSIPTEAISFFNSLSNKGKIPDQAECFRC